eukprot:31334-Pelagococcus_subviridis.AAC.4
MTPFTFSSSSVRRASSFVIELVASEAASYARCVSSSFSRRVRYSSANGASCALTYASLVSIFSNAPATSFTTPSSMTRTSGNVPAMLRRCSRADSRCARQSLASAAATTRNCGATRSSSSFHAAASTCDSIARASSISSRVFACEAASAPKLPGDFGAAPATMYASSDASESLASSSSFSASSSANAPLPKRAPSPPLSNAPSCASYVAISGGSSFACFGRRSRGIARSSARSHRPFRTPTASFPDARVSALGENSGGSNPSLAHSWRIAAALVFWSSLSPGARWPRRPQSWTRNAARAA